MHSKNTGGNPFYLTYVNPREGIYDGNNELTLLGHGFLHVPQDDLEVVVNEVQSFSVTGMEELKDEEISEEMINKEREDPACMVTFQLPPAEEFKPEVFEKTPPFFDIQVKETKSDMVYKIIMECILEINLSIRAKTKGKSGGESKSEVPDAKKESVRKELPPTSTSYIESNSITFRIMDLRIPEMEISASVTDTLLQLYGKYCGKLEMLNRRFAQERRMEKKAWTAFARDLVEKLESEVSWSKFEEGHISRSFEKYGVGINKQLTFDLFLPALIDFGVRCLEQVHPSDFLVLITHRRDALLESIEELTPSEVADLKHFNRLTVNSVQKKYRSFYIYDGAILVGRVEDRRGNILDENQLVLEEQLHFCQSDLKFFSTHNYTNSARELVDRKFAPDQREVSRIHSPFPRRVSSRNPDSEPEEDDEDGECSQNSQSQKVLQHDFLNYVHYYGEKKTILQDLAFAENFDHFLVRILEKGFNVSSSSLKHLKRSRISETLFLGRCWEIYCTKSRKKVGSLWDYPGAFCGLDFIPIEGCQSLFSDAFSMTVYKKEKMPKLYRLFTTNKTVGEVRESLRKDEGFYLMTRLFK